MMVLLWPHSWSKFIDLLFIFLNTYHVFHVFIFNLKEAGIAAGQAARATELRKHEENDAKCKELGWVCCVPMVVEAYGAWGTEAMESLALLASRLAISCNRAKAVVLAELYGRLNLCLVRANAVAILSRCFVPDQ